MFFDVDAYRIVGLAKSSYSPLPNGGRDVYVTTATEYFSPHGRPVVLLHNHHLPAMASTDDGSLQLYHGQDGLRFEATPWDNPTTRTVLGGLLDGKGIGVSVGIGQGGRMAKQPNGLFEVEAMIVREVSVLIANCPCCPEWYPPKDRRTWCTLSIRRHRIAKGSYGDLGHTYV